MSPSDTDPRAARLLAFAASLRRRHRRGAATFAALRTGLLLAVPVLPLAWLVPDWRLPLVLGAGTATALAALLAARRAAGLADAALLRSAEPATAGAELAVLGDELGTWLEAHRRGERTAMTGWLTSAIDDQLPQVPRQQLAPIGRRSLGGLLWLLPLLLLALLAMLLAELLAPPWPGALGGRPRDLPTAGGAGGGEAPGPGGAGGGDSEPDEAPPPEPKEPPAEKPPAAEPPAPEAAAVPPPDERPPLLDLPTQQRFLVPEFIGEGPTRRVRMHAAELEQGAPPPTAVARPSGDGAPAPVPPPQVEEFVRAAEAAQRARHVPPAERAIVQRFFTALREVAK
ncbi:MAG: hypothetical protein MUC36_06175 [Planctomycetes bacterium]|nr:hypothetical protein [Planctomycetota bacterium]